MVKAKRILSEVIDAVSRELVTTDHRVGSSFIRTPLIYPSGATVVVRVEDEGRDQFFVTDMGFGFREADLMGAARIYSRHAKLIADANGVGFDSQAFFVVKATRGQLPGAVVTVANCSLHATLRTSERLAREKESDAAEELLDRLVHIFRPENVARGAEVYGASTTPWEVTALVRLPNAADPTIFEPVANHKSSIAAVATKFNDLSRVDRPPHLVSVVHNKEAFGTLLGVLSQTSHVINDSVPDRTFLRLAEAA
jgi:hypothetical protein